MRAKRILIGMGLAASLTLFDQITKIWVMSSMAYHESIQILGNVVRLTYTRNPGIAFGISSGPLTGWPLMAITVIGSGLIAYILVSESRVSTWRTASMGILLGGAVGNLIDRLIRTEVVDFLDVGIDSSHRWPVFNVADAAVVVGIVLLLLTERKRGGRKRHASSETETEKTCASARI